MHDTTGSARLDALIDAALSLPPGERRAFVHEAAGDDVSLREAAERVLAEDDEGDAFLAPGGALAGSLFASWHEHVDPSAAPPTLEPGDLVGSYEVVERIGRGGMGEVYRARDARLGRDVALKVLPARVAADPVRLARFEREARVLASLSHPAIAAIYHLDESTTTKAIVLELVAGSTLAERLAEGPLPIAEALTVARRLTEALEAAHARGIVHRDLKPSNIKIDGALGVKVLDFGLARAFGGEGLAPPVPALSSLTDAVQPGAIVGTAAYMSPEQARGVRVDHRADIWAFGCVLYEMLCGRRAFEGNSTTEVIARVLEKDPDLARLPRETPPSIRRLLRRTFEKDPARRLHHIADARLDIDEALTGARHEDDDEASAAPGPVVPQHRPATVARWQIGAALAVGVGLAAAWLTWFGHTQPAPPVTRLVVPVPSGDELVAGQMPAVAVSPDGHVVAYRARRDGVIRLFLRALDEESPRLVPGSDEAAAPFFSPDGRYVGFDRDGVIMKAAVAGGPASEMARLPGGFSGAWRADGQVVVASALRAALFSMSEAGGPLIPWPGPGTIAKATSTLSLPAALPGTDALIVTLTTSDAPMVAVLGPGTPEPKVLFEGSQPRYVDSGHVVFARGGDLWAVRFDARRLEALGEPFPLQTGVRAASSGAAHFAVGRDGTLVYLPARDASPRRTLHWVAARGERTPVPLEPRAYSRATLSPDGTRLALSATDEGNQDIWVHDLVRGATTRLTFDPAVDTGPLWTPEGDAIVFRSDRDGGGLFRVAADGGGELTRLTDGGETFPTPYSFAPDGKTLLFSFLRTYRDQGIAAVHLDRPGETWVVLDGPFAELRPQVSPDGRWMAYQSDDSGRFEVYVRPYPDVGARRWMVSTAGGTSPQWSKDGRTVFYYDGHAIVGVDLAASPSGVLEVGTPRVAAEVALFAERLGPVFELGPDGRRFLVVQEEDDAVRATRGQMMLVRHWQRAMAEGRD